MDSLDKFKSTTAFTDLLFNILVGFVFLFLIAFLLINPKAKQGDIIVPAEFLITLTWPDSSTDDIDIWVKDKGDNLVGFSRKDAGIMFLDRDDLGMMNDKIVINGEEIVVKNNREVVSIRGKVANEYRISVHYYRKGSPYDHHVKNNGLPSRLEPNDLPVTVEVVKINPYKIIYKETQIMSHNGQIKNFKSFTVTSTGDVINIIDGLENVVPVSSNVQDRP